MKVSRFTLLLLLCSALFVAANEENKKEIATVKVASLPEGADIYVDEAFVGKTPAILKIDAGKHEIRIALNGYEEWKRPVEILADSELTLNPSLKKKQDSAILPPDTESPRQPIQFETAKKLEGKQFFILPQVYVRYTDRDPVIHFDETKGRYYTLFAPSGLTYEFRDYKESKGRFGSIYREPVVIRDVEWSAKAANIIVDSVNKPKRASIVYFRFSSDKVFWKLFNQCFATSLP